tara:strand:+ start:1431 stop:2681 length:1251 start_codon:yes stop_codon:yes gene_type:complete
MPRFHYKAADASGDTSEGIIEASDQAAVVERLRAADQLPIRVEELTPELDIAQTGLKKKLPTLLGRPVLVRPPLSAREIATFSRELATLLTAGLPLPRALSVTEKSCNRKTSSRLLARLRKRIQTGQALSAAMAQEPTVFNRFYVAMVRAGEASGDLAGVLERLHRELSRVENIRDSLRQALSYPVILLAVAVLSIAVLLVFVLPQFAALFRASGVDLPFTTRVVLQLAVFVREYGWLVLGSVVGAWIALRFALGDSTFKRRWHDVLLRAPLIGALIAWIEMQRFTSVVALLLRGGVPLPEALATAAEGVSNLALQHALGEAAVQVRQGSALAGALARQQRIPAQTADLVAIGEEVGEIATMFERTSELYQREIEVTVRSFVAFIEPALILVIGLIVAGLVFSVLSAIIGINALVL